MDEAEINVLVFGHPGSGKSSIISKILEIGGQISNDQIEIYKSKSKADSKKEKSDWYLYYVKSSKRAPTFGRIFHQRDGRKFMFFELQCDVDYLTNVMRKIKIATIGVLVVSGAISNNAASELDAIRTRKYLQLFCAVCGSAGSGLHISSKLIVLINKSGADEKSLKFINAAISKLVGYYLDTSKVDIISVSTNSGDEMHLVLNRLSSLSTSEDHCLRPEDCGITYYRMDSIFKKMWDSLVYTDAHLDVDSRNKDYWRARAEALYKAGVECNLEGKSASLEGSTLIKGAYRAAGKANQAFDDKLLCLILSHGEFENGNYKMAIKHYEKAKKLASKDKNSEDLYLTLGEDHVEKAKKMIKQQLLGDAKSLREDQKVEIKAETSDAMELEEAEKNVVQDKLEHLEIPQKISAKSCSSYLIDSEMRDTLYSGCRMISSSSSSSKKAFIPVQLFNLEDYESIETLGFAHPNILVLNDITESVVGGGTQELLVVEDVDTIDWFFSTMFTKFLEDKEFSTELIQKTWLKDKKDALMVHWWNLIAEEFHTIFGDVVNALLYLYSRGMPYGGLSDHIYVSRGKRGRILPCMDKKKNYEHDMEDLVKIMKSVIHQPGFNLQTDRKTDHLPPELQHFLSFVTKDKLIDATSSVSAAWLIDQPYFWCSPKRVNLMRKLRKCLQTGYITHNLVDDAVSKMMFNQFEEPTVWCNVLKDSMLKIIHAAGTKATVKQYLCNGDIVRFFNAVCSHANEHNLRSSYPYDDGVHEKIFRSEFPNIYTCLIDLIFDLIHQKHFKRLLEALRWF